MRRAFSSVLKALTYAVDEATQAYGRPMFTEEDLYIGYIAYDERIRCDTFLVCVGKCGEENLVEKYGHPQAHGWLHFGHEWEKKISEWRYLHAGTRIPAKEFVEFFDEKPQL